MLRSHSARFLSSASLPLPPRALTTIIKKAPTVRAVLKAYDGAADDANEVHVTSVWARLGELVMRGGGARAELRGDPPALARCREATLRLIPTADFGAAELAGTAHGLARARVGAREPWAALWTALQASTPPRLAEFTANELWVVAWAFSTHGPPPRWRALYGSLASEAAGRLDEFAPHGLVGLACSYARAGHAAPELLDGIAAELRPRLDELPPLGLSQLAWAMSKAGAGGAETFEAVEAAALPRLAELDAGNLATILRAFSAARVPAATPAPALLVGVAAEASRRASEFDGRAMATTVDALAAASTPEWLSGGAGDARRELLSALATEAAADRRRAGGGDALTVAQWGYLCRAFARCVPVPRGGGGEDDGGGANGGGEHGGGGGGGGLIGAAALAPVFEAAAAAATAEGALRDARPATLSSLAWAFGRVGGGVAEASPEAVPALAELHNAVAAEAAPRLGDFSPIDLHAMAIGLCRAPDGLPAPLAHAIVADVRSRDNFGAGRLATLGAALRRVGHGALAAGLDTGSQRGRAIRRYLRPASEDDGE